MKRIIVACALIAALVLIVFLRAFDSKPAANNPALTAEVAKVTSTHDDVPRATESPKTDPITSDKTIAIISENEDMVISLMTQFTAAISAAKKNGHAGGLWLGPLVGDTQVPPEQRLERKLIDVEGLVHEKDGSWTYKGYRIQVYRYNTAGEHVSEPGTPDGYLRLTLNEQRTACMTATPLVQDTTRRRSFYVSTRDNTVRASVIFGRAPTPEDGRNWAAIE